MRITPAKWDAEYSWLNQENGVRATSTSPKVELPKRLPRVGLASALGMALQAVGGAVLGFFALDAGTLLLLPLGAVLSGEIIIINSLGHGGTRSAGE